MAGHGETTLWKVWRMWPARCVCARAVARVCVYILKYSRDHDEIFAFSCHNYRQSHVNGWIRKAMSCTQTKRKADGRKPCHSNLQVHGSIPVRCRLLSPVNRAIKQYLTSWIFRGGGIKKLMRGYWYRPHKNARAEIRLCSNTSPNNEMVPELFWPRLK